MTMTSEDPIPANVPENGFYYHYKRASTDPVETGAYEVIGSVRHTDEKTVLVLYRPLYDHAPFFEGRIAYVRALPVWSEEMEKDGVRAPRFRKITDPAVIAALAAKRTEKYGA